MRSLSEPEEALLRLEAWLRVRERTVTVSVLPNGSVCVSLLDWLEVVPSSASGSRLSTAITTALDAALESERDTIQSPPPAPASLPSPALELIVGGDREPEPGPISCEERLVLRDQLPTSLCPATCDCGRVVETLVPDLAGGHPGARQMCAHCATACHVCDAESEVCDPETKEQLCVNCMYTLLAIDCA